MTEGGGGGGGGGGAEGTDECPNPQGGGGGAGTPEVTSISGITSGGLPTATKITKYKYKKHCIITATGLTD